MHRNTTGGGVRVHIAGGERGEIERERSQLVKEEASLQMAVQQMQRDIAQLRETITNLGNYWWRIHVYTCTCMQ